MPRGTPTRPNDDTSERTPPPEQRRRGIKHESNAPPWGFSPSTGVGSKPMKRARRNQFRCRKPVTVAEDRIASHRERAVSVVIGPHRIKYFVREVRQERGPREGPQVANDVARIFSYPISKLCYSHLQSSVRQASVLRVSWQSLIQRLRGGEQRQQQPSKIA